MSVFIFVFDCVIDIQQQKCYHSLAFAIFIQLPITELNRRDVKTRDVAGIANCQVSMTIFKHKYLVLTSYHDTFSLQNTYTNKQTFRNLKCFILILDVITFI